MERRYELRKEAMLAECEVAPQVFHGAVERLVKFVEPFAELLGQPAQQQHATDYLSGLISDLERKNVESIAYRHDQDRRESPVPVAPGGQCAGARDAGFCGRWADRAKPPRWY